MCLKINNFLWSTSLRKKDFDGPIKVKMKLASLVGASIRQGLLNQMERIEHFPTNWIW